MNSKIVLFAAAISLALSASAALAHHSFAMFDQTKEVELKNVKVAQWQWTAPHAWLYVTTADGKKWSLEGGNPGALRREGYGKGSFKVGETVTVYMSPLKDGRAGGAIRAIVHSNGTTFGNRERALQN